MLHSSLARHDPIGSGVFLKGEGHTNTSMLCMISCSVNYQSTIHVYVTSNKKRINEDDNLCGSSKDILLTLGFVAGS